MNPTTPIIEHEVTLPSGTRLRYGVRNPERAITYVFIHGWPDSWRSFEPVLHALPADIGAISVTMRGFGGSDAPPDGYMPDDFADDVAALAAQLGIGQTIFVGHSMGTLVARHLAVRHPNLVTGLVLIGGFTSLPDDLVDEVLPMLADLTDPISEEFVREFQSGTIATSVPEGFFDQIVAESLRAPASVWRAAFDGVTAAQPLGAVITAPTLLIWGDQDALVPRAQQDALLAAMPNAQLAVYAGAGHSPNWEQPSRVAHDIDAFRSTTTRFANSARPEVVEIARLRVAESSTQALIDAWQ